MIKNARDLLLPYQREVYDDTSRFIAWLASRQVGKSFVGGGWANRLCRERANTTVLIGSPSERQSLEAVEKCKQWAEANKISIVNEVYERESKDTLMKSATIVFPNKSRIVAVPGRPDTVRGFTAHVWLDEFAFFDDPAKTWKAVLPAVSNQLKGEKRVLLTSTPNGKGGRGKRFWEIITNKGTIEPDEKTHWTSGAWSVYRTDILAAAPYLGTDIKTLREAIDDEEAWQQEFLCGFIDASSVLLSYDLIGKCETDRATADPEDVLVDEGTYFAGIDFGRTNDPTVMWILKKVESRYVTAGVICLKNENTVDQFSALLPYIVKCAKVCVDYTGPGVGFGDLCAKEFATARTVDALGDEHVELCTFSQKFKCDIFPKLRTALDGNEIELPVDVECREDLHEMQQIIRDGKYNYAARRTAEGHSDRCTALALAKRATGFNVESAAEPPDNDEPWNKRGWLA